MMNLNVYIGPSIKELLKRTKVYKKQIDKFHCRSTLPTFIEIGPLIWALLFADGQVDSKNSDV
jgi:hypothetical protein